MVISLLRFRIVFIILLLSRIALTIRNSSLRPLPCFLSDAQDSSLWPLPCSRSEPVFCSLTFSCPRWIFDIFNSAYRAFIVQSRKIPIFWYSLLFRGITDLTNKCVLLGIALVPGNPIRFWPREAQGPSTFLANRRQSSM